MKLSASFITGDDVARYLPAARALGMATIHATDPTTTVSELKQIFGSHLGLGRERR